MCRVLSVPVGRFYAWRKRPPGAREQEDGKTAERIVTISHQHKGRYGSLHIHEQLRDEGIHVGRKRVIRLMKQGQLAAHHMTHRVVTTHADPTAMPAENVLNRAFEAEHPSAEIQFTTIVAIAPAFVRCQSDFRVCISARDSMGS